MNLLLIGPQGSGKGTQAEYLAQEYQLTIVEMGAQFRKVAQENNPRGQLINTLINQRGKLLPDGIVFDILKEHLERIDRKQGLVFDGYPRSVNQFLLLEEYLANDDRYLHLAIYLEIDDQTAITRLSGRLICSQCGRVYNRLTNPPPQKKFCVCGGKLVERPDDQPAAIKTRLQLFKQVTQPLLAVLEDKKILVTIDGSPSPSSIFQNIKQIIDKKAFI